MSNLQPNCCLKFDFQKVDQHAGGKWLIHDTKRRKDNQLQSLKLPAEYPSWVARCDIKGSVSTVLNLIFSKEVQGQKHPGRWGIVEHQIHSVKVLFKTNTKGHKHPSIRLLSKSKTQLVNQWETTLQCNVVSNWLGAFIEWSLYIAVFCLLNHRGHVMHICVSILGPHYFS